MTVHDAILREMVWRLEIQTWRDFGFEVCDCGGVEGAHTVRHWQEMGRFLDVSWPD